jgi:hypothetical protein
MQAQITTAAITSQTSTDSHEIAKQKRMKFLSQFFCPRTAKEIINDIEH